MAGGKAEVDDAQQAGDGVEQERYQHGVAGDLLGRQGGRGGEGGVAEVAAAIGKANGEEGEEDEKDEEVEGREGDVKAEEGGKGVAGRCGHDWGVRGSLYGEMEAGE